MKTGNLDGQGLAELRNYNIQNLSSAPTTNLYAGRLYFNTTDHTLYVYNGTQWLDALKQGVIYTEGSGIDITNNVISADLSASDIPSITLSKISDVTASASEVNVLDGITVTTANLNSVTSKIGLSDLSIDSGSTNYLEYSNSNGKFKAKVDTTVTASSSKLVTSGAVSTAIATALTGALKYQGTWTATSQTDYSGITTPVKKGYMYAVSGTATISSVEWNSGDYLVINKDVSSGTVTASDVEKIDNTEASDIVRLSSTQTLTNKTIDADDNTIKDLTASNFKSGVVQSSVRASSSASTSALVSEKAVRDAIDATLLKYSAQNSALTVSGGICTWTVTHNLSTSDVSVDLYEVSTGDKVSFDYSITNANSVSIKILSAGNIAANTYKVVVKG